MIWLPTVNPIWASSPAAWIAVLTSSPPLGGPLDVGCGAVGRSLPVSSRGEPARTARGPAGLGRVGGAGRLLLAVAGLGLGFGFGFAAPRSTPIRDGRVAGKLARTLG